jgi:hypothetical protein
MNDRCLTQDEITAYVDGSVAASLRTRIESHLSRCTLCLHNVAELKQLVDLQAASPTLPTDGALAKAESVIARHTATPGQFDITVTIRDGICRILETTGNLLLPRRQSTVPVRGRKRRGPVPRLAKSLSGYLVTVELTPAGDSVKPKLTLVDEQTSAKPDGVKTRLHFPGACETKYSHKGRVTFPALQQGSFQIEIEDIGTIGLDIQ